MKPASQKLKILHVANHFYPCEGGVERVVYDLASKLIERGNEVEVACLERCAYSEKKLPQSGDIDGIRVARMPFIDLKYYKIAPSVLAKAKDVDIVHVHGVGFFSDFLALTKFLHKKPVVVSTHGGIFHTDDLGFLKKIYFNLVQRFVLSFADNVLAVSIGDLKAFRKICPKAELLENGVELSGFRAGKKTGGAFLFVGRFSKNKKVENLLRAFAELGAKSKFRLIVAGTDWEHLLSSYKKTTQRLGIGEKVEFVLNPSHEALKKVYSSSEFFVSASEHEGFGLSLVEAMASGCIPVVQANESFSNIVQDGKSGIIVDYANAQGAAEKISKALGMGKNEKEKYSRKAVERSKAFSWKGKIEKLESVYREAVAWAQ